MSGDDIARILFLSILAASFAAVALRRYRGRRADMLKQAAIWAVIILSLTALYTYLDGAKAFRPSHPRITANTISVPRAPDGHYHITMAINGKNLEAIVDTGASDLVLSLDAARKAGIDTDALRFLGAASTANGQVKIARVYLEEVKLGSLTARNVPAAVNGGEMDGVLLGMRFLERFEKIEFSGNRLTLTQ